MKIEPLPAELGSGEFPLESGTRRSPKIVELLLKLVPGQVADISGAVHARDADAVMAHAHKLKGSCLSVGAIRMAQLCHSIEACGRVDEVDEAARFLPDLERALVDLRRALEAEREENASRPMSEPPRRR